jgi:hypothetical protein
MTWTTGALADDDSNSVSLRAEISIMDRLTVWEKVIAELMKGKESI